MTGNCQGVVAPDGTVMVPQWTAAGDQVMVPAGDQMNYIVAWPVEDANCGGAWMVPQSMAGNLQDMPQLQHQMQVSGMGHVQSQPLHQAYCPAQPQQMMHNSIAQPFAGHADPSGNSGYCYAEGWQLQAAESQDTAVHGRVFVHDSDGALRAVPPNFGTSSDSSPSPELTEEPANSKIGGKIFVHSADGALHHVAQCSPAGELVEVDVLEEEKPGQKPGQAEKRIEVEEDPDVFGDFFREHWRLDEEENSEDLWRYEGRGKQPVFSQRSREQRMEELRALQTEQQEHEERQRQRQRRMEDLLKLQREEEQLRSVPKLRVLQRNKDALCNFNQDEQPSLKLSGLNVQGQSRPVGPDATLRGASPGSSIGSSSGGSTTASTGDLAPQVAPPATSSALGAIGDRLHMSSMKGRLALEAQPQPRASRHKSKQACREGPLEHRAVARLILRQAYSQAALLELPSLPSASSSAPKAAAKAPTTVAQKRKKANQASSSRSAAAKPKPAPAPPVAKKPERRRQVERQAPGLGFRDLLALPGRCWNQARSLLSATRRRLVGAHQAVAALLHVAVKATPGGAPALVVAAIFALVSAFLAAVPSDDRGLAASSGYYSYGHAQRYGYRYGQSYPGYGQPYGQPSAMPYGQPYGGSYAYGGSSSSDGSWSGYSLDEVFSMSETELAMLRQQLIQQGYDVPSWPETKASGKSRNKKRKSAGTIDKEAARQTFQSLQDRKGQTGGTFSKASKTKSAAKVPTRKELRQLLQRYGLPEDLQDTMEPEELVEGLEFMKRMQMVAYMNQKDVYAA